MFIDIHVHVSRIVNQPKHGTRAFSTAEQLIKRYDAIGVEAGVLLPLVSPEVYLPQSNEDILDVWREHPTRFIPFCNVDPRSVSNSSDAPLGEILDYYKQQGCRGLGEVTANLPFLDPMVQNLFRHTERVGFPLTFHISHRMSGTYGLYDDPGLPQLERSLARFPNLMFLGHSQTFWAEIGALRKPEDRAGYPSYSIDKEGVVPRLMRQHENLYGDLSAGSGFNALKRDPTYAVAFLEEFQDRLMFGTDICAPNTTTPLVDFLLDLRRGGSISETVFQKVARKNALRVLNLHV